MSGARRDGGRDLGDRLGDGGAGRARLIMIGVLMAGVMIVQVTLPAAHPLRAATGGDARLWLLLLAFGGIIWAYRAALVRLRRRARPAPPDATRKAGSFSDSELSRYARHIVLREIGGPGQKALREARVLVIGAGGLGSPVLQYLAGAGVGTIGVIDDDTVENANLARQVIHSDARIGDPRCFPRRTAMRAQNPFVTVRPITGA